MSFASHVGWIEFWLRSQRQHRIACAAERERLKLRGPCTYNEATGECAGSCRYCRGHRG